jgi:hypothetical protein
MRRLALSLLAGAVLIVLAGCAGGDQSSAPPSAQALSSAPTKYPTSGGNALVEPEKGAVITLGSGAEVSIPPGTLSQTTLVSLRETDAPASVPVPRTMLGPAFELSLGGANLGGIAILKLPLPEGVTTQEYDVGVYRRTGQTWERVSGRPVGDRIQIATQSPGVFALQGTWRLGAAQLVLSQLPGSLEPGMATIPFTVTGMYRFSALPALQRGYTPVRLVLKRDTSGGAGQVTGDVDLDQTVADTSLWFQPEPNRPSGEIQFQHVFEIPPGELNVTPGSTSRYYAVLHVEDSEAPTSQLSTGVDYKHVLPIRIVGREVVRPDLTRQNDRPLQWHVRLNGQTWQEIPAAKAALPLDDLLASGGIGDYTITLETQAEGEWITASNQVTVRLAPPPTATPMATETSELAALPGTPLVIGTPTPGESMPPTPTRRPRPALQTPEETPSVSPTPEISATPVVTATPTVGSQVFWADSGFVGTGECTNLHWNVQNVSAVYLNGEPVTGMETRRVCPEQTTTYVLRTESSAGTQERRVTVSVSVAGAAFDFAADAYQIAPGDCTVLRWRAQGVRAVYLNNEGVSGEATQQVCPAGTTTYTLRVVGDDDVSTSRSLTILVTRGSGIPLRFWADQYTMNPGACTNLNWWVTGVEAVYVGVTGSEKGVAGVGSEQVCPSGLASYTLRATTADGRSDSREIVLLAQKPSLRANEVIVQGTVRDLLHTDDVSSDSPGNQPGWEIVVDGLDVLFPATSNCCQDSVTVQIPQALIDQPAVFGVPIDWPINPGQGVEFRAVCTDAECSLDSGPPMYLRLRTQ